MTLFEHGADPNVADEEGHTFMHVCDSLDLMATLLKHGADPSATSKVQLRACLRCPTTHT